MTDFKDILWFVGCLILGCVIWWAIGSFVTYDMLWFIHSWFGRLVAVILFIAVFYASADSNL